MRPPVYGLIEVPDAGWTAVTASALVLGAACFVAFIAVEARTAAPMLSLGIFRSPGSASR